MKKFAVCYLEVCRYYVEVEAENEDEAERLAFKMLDEDEEKHIAKSDGYTDCWEV